MKQLDFDKSVRAFFFQIVLISSKVSSSADVSEIIEKFYASHFTSKMAVVEIDSILQSIGIYKIGKEGMESYIFKKIKNKISAEDTSRILNAGINLITRILYREELERKIISQTYQDIEMELKSEIEFLQDEISNRISWQNSLLTQYREQIVSSTISLDEHITSTNSFDLKDLN